jgi:hypothetical protein
MQINDALSPLAFAAELLFTRRDDAPAEALRRAKSFQARGSLDGAAFWLQVAIETTDAIDTTCGSPL